MVIGNSSSYKYCSWSTSSSSMQLHVFGIKVAEAMTLKKIVAKDFKKYQKATSKKCKLIR